MTTSGALGAWVRARRRGLRVLCLVVLVLDGLIGVFRVDVGGASGGVWPWAGAVGALAAFLWVGRVSDEADGQGGPARGQGRSSA